MPQNFITTMKRIDDSLPYGDGIERFATALGKSRNDTSSIELREILSTCGLEPCLWALRTIETDRFDSKLRLLSCNVVEYILNDIRRPFTDDLFPDRVLRIARDFAKGNLSPVENEDFIKGVTFRMLMDERNERYGKGNNVKLIGFSISRGVVETTYPDAKLAAYFSILTANAYNLDKEQHNKHLVKKIEMVNAFLENPNSID